MTATVGLCLLSGNTCGSYWESRLSCLLLSTRKLMAKQKECIEPWHRYFEHYYSRTNLNCGLKNSHMWNLQSTLLQMQPPRNLHLNCYMGTMLFSRLIWQLELNPHTLNQLTLQPKFETLFVRHKNRLQSLNFPKNSNMTTGRDTWSST